MICRSINSRDIFCAPVWYMTICPSSVTTARSPAGIKKRRLTQKDKWRIRRECAFGGNDLLEGSSKVNGCGP